MAGQMLAVDPVTGDLTIGGDVVEGLDAIRQHVRLRCRLFRGEWFLDPTAGVPYLQRILGVKNPNLDLLRQAMRDAIESTPGIARVLSLDVRFDRATREASVTFRATTDEGELVDTFSSGVEQ